MKKLIICITLIAGSHLASAQQKYFPFNISGKHGITDVLGNELVKPAYNNSKIIEAKSQIYLTGSEDKQSVIVDSKTGVKQFFEYIYINQVNIKDVPYSLVFNKDKRFLLSEESSKTIDLTEEYWDFDNVGNYIIAGYYPKSAPSKITSYDKNGIPLPPKIEPVPEKTFTILANDETLKRLIKGSFDTYNLMYKIAEKEKQEDERIVKMVTITLEDFTKPAPNFDYILLNKGNNHSLYNAKLDFIKTFVVAKATQEQLLSASEKIVNHNLVYSPGNNYPAPMVMASPSVSQPVEPKPEKVEKKPFKPYFYTENLANGKTLFARQETEENSNHILELEAGVKLRLNEKEHTLTIVSEEKENSKFSFDPKTGVIYLPKAYLKQLGLTIL